MSQDIEHWKPVVGYERLYEVSSEGRLCKVFKTRIDARLLNPTRNKRYLRAGLWKDGVQRNIYVHVLVAAAFIGPRPEGLEVRHLNGVHTDNRVSNLQYGTKGENRQDSIKHGTHYYASRTACSRGHAYTVENTRVRVRNGRQERVCLECARMRESWRDRRVGV